MTTTFKVTGFKELNAALKELPRATAKRVARKVMIEALKPMASDMRDRAPKNEGDLQEGITVGTKLTRSQKSFGFNGGRKSPSMLVVHAGPGPHPQAILQELGTYKEPAQAFVAPAWDAGHDAVLNRVAAGLGREIMAAAKRAAAKRGR